MDSTSKRKALHAILQGRVIGAEEARQALTGSTQDVSLLSDAEQALYLRISDSIARGGYDSLTDEELLLCLLLWHKAEPSAPGRDLLAARDLTRITPDEADRLQWQVSHPRQA